MNITTISKENNDRNNNDKKQKREYSKERHHKNLCKQIHDTWIKKNKDYGDSFGRSFKKRGIAAAMVRMEDKWNRLDNLTRLGKEIQVSDESVIDTLLDLSNYCIMTVMELQREEYVKKYNREKKEEDGETPKEQ